MLILEQHRERLIVVLNLTTVIFANRTYAVLKRKFSDLGVGEPDPRAADLLDVRPPDLDWVPLAKDGSPGTCATTLDTFGKALQMRFQNEGPMLVEVRL